MCVPVCSTRCQRNTWKPSLGSNNFYKNGAMPHSMTESFPPAEGFTATEEGSLYLQHWGVPGHDITVTGIPFLGLMGTVGAFCVLIAVLIAVSLTPALLGLIGRRALSRRERARLQRAQEVRAVELGLRRQEGRRRP